MTPTTTTSRTAYTGWVRVGGRGPWTAAVTAASYDDALGLLMTYTREHRWPHCDLLINEGDNPNRRPSRFVRTTPTDISFHDAEVRDGKPQ
jgi:hypothetical protein